MNELCVFGSNIYVYTSDTTKPLQSPSSKWRIILKGILKTQGFEDVDWIHLPQDKDKCSGLVNTAMNICVAYMVRNISTS
jgi:hypothetical protein